MGIDNFAKGLTIDEIEITKIVAVNTVRYMHYELKKYNNLPNEKLTLIVRLVIKTINESCDDVCKAYRLNR